MTRLLTSTPAGATDYLDADLREPRAVATAAARTLDFRRPVAVILMAVIPRAVLQHIPDEEDPRAIVAELPDAAPGSG